MLLSCIGESQSSFVLGRLISDNVMIAFELLHALRLKNKGKKGFAAVQLDMSKAFDRVEWLFIEAVMRKMGFNERWISLIMQCITSVSHRVVLSRCVSEAFKPERGLRQGDPLSPYLFLLNSEGLSIMLSKCLQDRSLKKVKASNNGPKISHLFFADDNILFLQANMVECNKVKDVLKIYEERSG